jgi:hypothetical protein
MKPITCPAGTCAPFWCARGEGGEVGVEELVALPVAQPEAVAGGVVPADRVEGPSDRDERLAEAAVDVGAAPVPSQLGVAVRVADAGLPNTGYVRPAVSSGVETWGRPTSGPVGGGRS